MKKILLIVSIFTAINLNAQVIPNNSFENWFTDTAIFEGFNFFKPDTFAYSDPVSWTTTNALSGADTFGAFTLVTETNQANTGSSAMRIYTAAFDTVGTPLGPRQLTIPGLAVNGKFPLDIPQDVLLLGGTISPVLIPGAGTPFTQRLAYIKGFYKYTPVFNDSTGTDDSCMVWATLKRGTEIIANAVFTSNSTLSTYTAFSAPFVYVSCSVPDTLVILIASSVPNLGALLYGTTRLTPGSVLFIDDLDYDTLAAGAAFPPIANADNELVLINTAKVVAVTANDDDCDNPSLTGETVSVVTTAINGTTSAGGASITYTPSNGFLGEDSFSYRLYDGTNYSAAAWVKVIVVTNIGIIEANQVQVSVYPVPATDELNIRFENSGKTTLRVVDVTGKLVLTADLTKNNNTINVRDLANGIYGIQLTDANNSVIARSKFTMSK